MRVPNTPGMVIHGPRAPTYSDRSMTKRYVNRKTAGHLLPEPERRKLLQEEAARRRAATDAPATTALDGALDTAPQGLLRQIEAGDLSRAWAVFPR